MKITPDLDAKLTEVYSKRSKELERVLLKMGKMIDRLKRFSGHANSCHSREYDDPTCTCGYSKLLKEIERL